MECKLIPVASIELDLDNPRIKQWLEIYNGKVTSEGIALALSASSGSKSTSTYSSLKESIRVNRGIINPIVLNRNHDGKMTVIEGNTRVQIYKEFGEADPAGPWKEIVALVYDDLPLERIHAIRLQAHLVGPRDWDPFSKAKYLNQLSNIDKMPMEMIISFCGGKGPEIRRLIDAYVDMLKYYFPLAAQKGAEPDPHEFSKFAELQNRGIVSALLRHKYDKGSFASWVLHGNVDTAQGVRLLPQILDNVEARAAFLHGTITEAQNVLARSSGGNKDFSSIGLYDLTTELTKRIRNIEYQEVKALTYDPRYEEKKAKLMTLRDELDSLSEDIDKEV